MIQRGVLALTFFAAVAVGQRYDFVSIVDTSDERFSTIGQGLAINNNGRVAFGVLDPRGRPGVFSGDGGPLTTIAPVAPRGIGAVSSINEAGMVAFAADDPERGIFAGVYNGDGGPIQTVFEMMEDDRELEFGLDVTGTVSINNAGETAFMAVFNDGMNVMIGGTGGVRPAAFPFAEPANAQLLGAAMNEEGRVAFARLFPPSFLTAKDHAVQTISGEDQGTVFIFNISPRPSINDSGAVAFVDGRRDGVFVLVHQDGQEHAVADLTNGYSDFKAVSINNDGAVAFVATTDRFTVGIYNGADPVDTKVIETGDQLFGGEVQSVEISRFMTEFLNDSGQVAFWYRIRHPERGRVEGIAVATPRQVVPVLSEGGVVNAASFGADAPSPGSMVSIYGADFATKLTVASGSPLPTTLDGVTVEFDGIAAPLFFTSAGQINAQVPFALSTARTTQVRVRTANGASESRTLDLAAFSPAVYTLSQSGSGQGIVVFAETGAIAGPLGATRNSQPARAGDALTLYANGLGAVTPAIASGQNSCDPDGVCAPDFSNLILRRVVAQTSLSVGGVPVPPEDILYAGLAPQFVGLYQINFILPAGIEPGDDRPIVIELQRPRVPTASSQPDVTIAVRGTAGSGPVRGGRGSQSP